MDRRFSGFLALVVAMLALGVVPNVLGRSTAGTPQAEVIADPPAVGQCVTAIADSTSQDQRSGGSVVVAAPWSLPVASIAPRCAGKVIGEVISVRTTTRAPSISTLEEYYRSNPDCRSQVEAYLGTKAETTIMGVEWRKSLFVDAVTVGPNAHDKAAGRTWTACVLSTVGQWYQAPAPLRSSWATRRLPDAFGLCWAAEIVPYGLLAPCSSPHTTQQLADGFVEGPSDSSTSIVSAAPSSAVLSGCRQVAASIMGVTDPTMGNRLTVKVVSDPVGGPYVRCAVRVTGDRKLVGSIIGLGTKRLPLA
jgi:hypothetical protein